MRVVRAISKDLEDRSIRTPRRECSARGLINSLRLLDGLSLHFEINSGVAIVVVTLAWPSHWLIVTMSTPARSRWTERYRHIWEERFDHLDQYLQQMKAKETTRHGRGQRKK